MLDCPKVPMRQTPMMPSTCPLISTMIISLARQIDRHRVEAPITDHLRDCAPNLEKYKEVKPMQEDKNQEDCKKNYSFIPSTNNSKFLKPKVGLNITPMSTSCHNCLLLLALALKTRTCGMTLLVPTKLEFNMSLIQIQSHHGQILIPDRLPTGT